MNLHIEILIIIAAANLKNPLASSILMLPTDNGLALPRTDLQHGCTCMGEAIYLLKQYTGISAWLNGNGWVPLVQKKLVDDAERIEKQERCIGIPYVGYLPAQVPPCNGAQWFVLSSIMTKKIYKDHLQIIKDSLLEV